MTTLEQPTLSISLPVVIRIATQEDVPRFFGCPDLPVPKWDKRKKRLVVANEGLHFNGILVLSHFGRGLLDPERDLPREPYVLPGRRLERIHVTPIEEGSMASYTFKSIGKASDQDDILILPRTCSEMSGRRPGIGWKSVLPTH